MRISFPLIIAVFVISLIMDTSLAYAQSSNSTIRYVPLHGYKLEAQVYQGQSTTLPVQVNVPHGDKIINLLLSLSPWPDGIYGTVSPQVIQNTYAANTTLQVYIQPYVKPGNYTLNIVAQGWVNDTEGKVFGVNSEAPVPLPVIVQARNGTLSISLGNMTDMKRESYCYHDGCSSFTSFEKFQLLLRSAVNTTVSLSGPDVPAEKWIHFDPVNLNTGLGGTESTITIAGMVQSLTGNNPVSTKIFTARAESQDGSTAHVFFPYENNFNMSILRSVEPINFTLQFTTNISNDNYGTYGVVYDPGGNGSIPVHLSVAGLEQNSQVVPLPPSIDASINKTSFVLNSSQIYYIPIMVKTSNASVGHHYIAINETIGGKQFLSALPLYVMPNICMGGPGMCGPPPSSGKNSHTDVNLVASPLEQFKSGTAAKDVICRDEFSLVIKAKDKTPACVRPNSIKGLVERGWISAEEKPALKVMTKSLCNGPHPPTQNAYDCHISNSSTSAGNQTLDAHQAANGLRIELANQTYEAGYPVNISIKNINQDYGCKIPSVTVREESSQLPVFGPTPERDYGHSHCADPWHVTFYAGLENNSLVTKPTRYQIIAALDNLTYQREFTAIPSNYSETRISPDSSILPGFLTFTSCLPVQGMPPNNGTLVGYSGFGLYHRYLAGPDSGTDLDDYLLRPGQTGSFVMQVHQGQFMPGHNLAGGLSFLSGNLLNVDNTTVWKTNRAVASQDHPGLDVIYSPSFALAGPDGYATVTVSISARQDAPRGSYWLYLPPGMCGGHRVLLTVDDKPISQPPDYIGYDFDSSFVVDTANQLVFRLINPGIHTFESCTLGYTSKNQTIAVKTFDVIPPGMEYKHIWNATSNQADKRFLECRSPHITKVYPDMVIDGLPW